jgi:hypothetical protein
MHRKQRNDNDCEIFFAKNSKKALLLGYQMPDRVLISDFILHDKVSTSNILNPECNKYDR